MWLCARLERASIVDMHVRAATVDDADAIARVHIASSNDAYAPLAKQWRVADDVDLALGHDA